MGSHRFRALLAVTAVFVSAACGQKAGVGGADPAVAPVAAGVPTTVSAGGDAGVAPVTETTTAASAESAAAGPAAPARPGTPATPGARPASSAGSPTPATSGPTASGGGRPAPSTTTTAARSAARGEAPAAAAPADPRDRNGVTDKEIVIGIHAPLTGAAPVPQDSIDKAKDLYWKFLAERGGVFGRNVRVVIRDDQFNPSRAVTVCRELVEQEKVFLLVGIGTDQVVPCARYASQAGVPYFSTGGSEAAVAGLNNYFGISMSFPAQAPLLAQMARKAGKTKVAVVVINTPNYDDIFAALVASSKDVGLNVVRTSRMSKQPSQSEVLAEVNNLRTSGAEAVFLAVAPTTFLNLAHAAKGQAYSPLWAGPGLSSGLNLIAEFGCPSIEGARFLSPFPQIDVIDRFDADYKPAYRKFNKEEPDDLGLAVWGMAKVLHRFFEAAGPDVGRARFVGAIQSGREFTTNVFPPVRYAPGRQFGAAQSHLLEADCANRRWKTLATFATSF
jgi:ABC-type branched-subunit amino acid transport system substrate-binding protein